jgi:hypothetical protein
MEGKRSKRGRFSEGRPTKRTTEAVAKIAEAVAIGLTDEETALLAGINPDTMTEWRKDPEFSGAIKRTEAQRLLLRLSCCHRSKGWSVSSGEKVASCVKTTQQSQAQERQVGTGIRYRHGCIFQALQVITSYHIVAGMCLAVIDQAHPKWPIAVKRQAQGALQTGHIGPIIMGDFQRPGIIEALRSSCPPRLYKKSKTSN